jgi:hypothetical protein
VLIRYTVNMADVPIEVARRQNMGCLMWGIAAIAFAALLTQCSEYTMFTGVLGTGSVTVRSSCARRVSSWQTQSTPFDKLSLGGPGCRAFRLFDQTADIELQGQGKVFAQIERDGKVICEREQATQNGYARVVLSCR